MAEKWGSVSLPMLKWSASYSCQSISKMVKYLKETGSSGNV